MTTEIVPTRAADAVRLDQIDTLGAAMQAAQVLAQSDLVPRSLYGKPANVLLVYLNGRELGLTMAQSVRTIFSPGPGQIGLRVSLMLAKLREAGHDYDCEYSDAGDSCTFTLTRADTGKDYSASFGLDDAKAAGLVTERNGELVALSRDGKPLPWMTYRSDMLFARSASRCVNRYAPEVTLGMEVIGPEGIRDDVILDVPPQAVSTAAGGAEVPPAAAQHTEELAGLDAQGKAEAAGTPGPPAGGGGDDALPAPGSSAPAGTVSPDEPADSATRRKINAGFRALGMDPQRHGPDVRRACTMFTHRRISNSAELTMGEAARLIITLGVLETTNEPDHQVVALADAISQWEHDWFEEDPDAYTTETGRTEPL